LGLLHLALEQIHHPKRFVGALIFGIVSLLTLIASMTIALVALTQQIQTAHYVNTVTKNVSNILHFQNDINRDLQQGILKLQEELNLMGETLPGVVQYIQLTCNSWYHHICITAAQWNGTYHNWTLIQHNIQGAWTQNSTVCIQHLTKDTVNIQATHLSIISWDSIKSWLNKLNPIHWFNFGLKGLTRIGGLMLLCLLSIIWLKRLITHEINHFKKRKISKHFFCK
jgi:hypothetical protein